MNHTPQRFKAFIRQGRLTRRSLLGRLAALGLAIPVLGPQISSLRREKRAGAASSAGNQLFDPSFDHQYFDFAHLDRVMPLNQSVVAGDAEITVTSLELYHHGFNVVLLFTHDDVPSPVLAGALPVMTAHDNLGGQYHGKMRSGAGGGNQLRVIYSFAPTLNPKASSLTLELIWVKSPVSSSPETGVVYDEENVVDGPWSMDIPISRASRDDRDNRAGSTIQRIVPVAQHQDTSGYSITLFSLELYKDSFEGLFRVDWAADYQSSPNTGPRAKWSVRDDRGTEYRRVNGSGGGGGLPPDPNTGIWHKSWRMAVVFRPPIDPNASELTLEIPEIHMIRHEPGVDPEVTETIPGPWRFNVRL